MKKNTRTKKITSERVVVTSFIVGVSDVVINVAVSYISGSVVMLSQALGGVADLLATSLLLLGIKRAKLPSDRRHPYGYGRELYFWTFLAALSTFTVTAGMSFYYGLNRLLNPEKIENINLALLALVIAMVTNGYSMNLSLKRLLGGRSMSHLWKVFTGSALIETKTTLVLDVMGTLASFLGLMSLLLYTITGDLRFDGLGAMAIGLTLAFLALFILKGAKDLLVGQSASLEVEEKIKKITTADSNVHKVIDLRTLHIGPERLLINMEVNLDDELKTSEIETLIDKIENEIRKEIPEAKNIQIELETPDI